MMKKLLVFCFGAALCFGCHSGDYVASVFTGNQSTYALQQGSAYAISGTATFKERKDGATTVVISLTGITDNDQHPVHLHLGNMSTNQASIAALLTPVEGKTGQSETIITQLADETKVSYHDLVNLDACVNVHLASFGPEATVLLAVGNVGSAVTKASNSSRIGVCKSN